MQPIPNMFLCWYVLWSSHFVCFNFVTIAVNLKWRSCSTHFLIILHSLSHFGINYIFSQDGFTGIYHLVCQCANILPTLLLHLTRHFVFRNATAQHIINVTSFCVSMVGAFNYSCQPLTPGMVGIKKVNTGLVLLPQDRGSIRLKLVEIKEWQNVLTALKLLWC